MRIAVIRGPNLNPWELANFDLGEEVVAFGSSRGVFEGHGLPLTTRRLPSPTDALGRLPGPGQGLVLRFTGSLDHLRGLEEALRGFDIAHTAELATPYSLQAIRARDRGACRRVVATVWENIAAPQPPNRRVAARMRAVAAGVDRCIAISDRARLHLELAGVPADRIDVLPMGVDVEHFSPADPPTPPADGVGPLRVLSVARLVSEKGVEDLVVALRLLTDRGVDATLTLVGSGPLRGWLETLADELGVADRLTLAGTVVYDELPAIYRVHDAFVLASAPRATWREQFGFAVVEAMASGLPVLAGRSGSLDEVVGDPAQLVTPHDPGELADALAALAADPFWRRARGEDNRARALERYDRRAVAPAIHEVYERALAAPPRTTA